MNVIGDLILQKFILKLSGFLFIVLFCMWYVDHIYIYAKFGSYNSAFFVENLNKKAVSVKIISQLV